MLFKTDCQFSLQFHKKTPSKNRCNHKNSSETTNYEFNSEPKGKEEKRLVGSITDQPHNNKVNKYNTTQKTFTQKILYFRLRRPKERTKSFTTMNSTFLLSHFRKANSEKKKEFAFTHTWHVKCYVKVFILALKRNTFEKTFDGTFSICYLLKKR
jgi:hypothetical protein